MKKILIFYLTLFIVFQSFSQIKYDDEIITLLKDKKNVHEIEGIIQNYFDQKIKQTSLSDTITLKHLKRQQKFLNRKIWLSRLYTNNNGEEQNMHLVNRDGISVAKRMKPTASQRSQPSEWIQAGPSTTDKGIGRVDKLAFHPTNPNIIFAGSTHGGLFKTIDYGESWFPISEFLPSLGIAGIAINYNDPDVLYVLTGDPNDSGGCFSGNVCFNLGEYISTSQGVYKSDNGGITWTQIIDFFPFTYRGLGLKIHPTNPNILFAATTEGFFRTTNGGSTWTLISPNVVLDIEFHPTNSNILYTCTSNGFWVSTNGGNNFSFILSVPSADRMSVAVTGNQPNYVYLLGSNDISSTMLLSNDSGQNFVVASNQHVIEGQSSYNHVLVVNPTNADDVWAGGVNLWRSNNLGVTWTQQTNWQPSSPNFLHADMHDLQYSPLTSDLWCANDGGVYLFKGNNWQSKYFGLTITQFYKFERLNRNGKIFGGAQDNYMQEQVSGNEYKFFWGGDGFDIMTDHPYHVNNGNSENTYYTTNDQIVKNCGGCTINVPANTNFFGNLAMSPIDKDKIYVGYQTGLWRSVNAGVGWVNIAPLQSANWCVSSSIDDKVVYFAGSNGLFKYVEGSGIFNITPNDPYNINLQITDIDVSRVNANHLYISVAGTGEKAKVFRSLDGGLTWENLTLNLPNLPVLCIKLDASGGIYIGTSAGVFYKPSSVNFWQPFSNGLPNVPVSEIELYPEPHPTNGKLPPNPPPIPEIWISTFGRGMWYTQQYTPNCPFNLSLSGAPQGNRLEEAVNNITSTQTINTTGNTVKYNASKRITLNDGFRVSGGSRFKTYLSGCGGQTID